MDEQNRPDHDRKGRKRLPSDERTKDQPDDAARRRSRSAAEVGEEGEQRPMTKRERDEPWPIG